MREKPLLTEALWATSKRCIVQCLLVVTIWKFICYFKSQHPSLTEETRTVSLNWKQGVLWYFDRALLGKQSSVTHSNVDVKRNWIFAVSQFQVNKIVRKTLVSPLVCCQTSYDELFTSTAWLPPDHTCSRAWLRIYLRQEHKHNDIKGPVAGSLLSPWQQPPAKQELRPPPVTHWPP